MLGSGGANHNGEVRRTVDEGRNSEIVVNRWLQSPSRKPSKPIYIWLCSQARLPRRQRLGLEARMRSRACVRDQWQRVM